MGNGLFKHTNSDQNNLGGIRGDSPANVLKVCIDFVALQTM